MASAAFEGNAKPGASMSQPIPSTDLILGLICLTTLVHCALQLHREYLAFLALGPGGTPSTLQGFMRVKALSFFALRDVYTPRQSSWLGSLASLSNPVSHDKQMLQLPSGVPSLAAVPAPKLPVRLGPRPQTHGIAPHRQITQKGTAETFTQTRAALYALAIEYSGVLEIGTSCFEPYSVGLSLATAAGIAHDQVRPKSWMQDLDKLKRGDSKLRQTQGLKVRHCCAEVAHVHPSDGSLHVVLPVHLVDMVLEAHWGERHPLARGGWWEKFVPEGFVMVYAPRTASEVATVVEIVKLAVEGLLTRV